MLPKKRIISIDLSFGKYSDFLDAIISASKERISHFICIANVHMLIEAAKDKEFKNIVNSSFITTPDGVPLTWALRLLYGIKQERVAGMDLFPDLLGLSQKEGVSVFFYGSTEEILERIKDRAKKEHPKLKISGSYSPPFRDLSNEEKEKIINLINSSDTDIVFVSLGCPKQERWMYEMKEKVKALMIGVGGAFPVYAGVLMRAPIFMQKLGLEWLFRLIQEPKRLFKRYLLTNTLFLFYLAKEIIKKLIRGDKYE